MILIFPKRNFHIEVVIQLGLAKNILFVIFLLIYSIVKMDVINLNLHLNLILQKTCELKFGHFLDKYCFQTYLAQIISLLILGPRLHKNAFGTHGPLTVTMNIGDLSLKTRTTCVIHG
jgi:hypothetical protein